MSDATLSYSVPAISCGHCRAAISAEVERLDGVRAVNVDLAARRVTVSGAGLDDDAVRAAIDAAGYAVEDAP